MSSLSVELVLRLEQDGMHWAARNQAPRGMPLGQGYAPGDWAQACEAVLAALPRGRLHRLDRAAVWLGFPHVHYAVLPWQGFRDPADCEALAQAMFDDWLEGAGVGRCVAVADAPYGAPRLAVAVDAALLDGLQALLHDAGLRRVQCQPLLLAALSRFAGSLRRDCAFALAEPQALTCVYRSHAQWSGVCSLRSAPGTGIGARLAAAQALLGVAPPPLLAAGTEAALEPPAGTPEQGCKWLGIVQPWHNAGARGHARTA